MEAGQCADIGASMVGKAVHGAYIALGIVLLAVLIGVIVAFVVWRRYVQSFYFKSISKNSLVV